MFIDFFHSIFLIFDKVFWAEMDYDSDENDSNKKKEANHLDYIV